MTKEGEKNFRYDFQRKDVEIDFFRRNTSAAIIVETAPGVTKYRLSSWLLRL